MDEMRQQPQRETPEQDSLEAIPKPERIALSDLATDLDKPGAGELDLDCGQFVDQSIDWRRR